MTIDRELEGQILRYHHVERWGVNTIARPLGVHHSVVDRVLSQAGMPKIERTARRSMIDPYVPFILDTLARFPTMTAARLYHMVRERGYSGAESHFRARVAGLRPRPTPEAYLRLKTLPGEQAQVDWGQFGQLTIGRATRPLMGFVMVLSYSRAVFLRFFLVARAASFAAGHVEALGRWGGGVRVLLYDNLRSAVLERLLEEYGAAELEGRLKHYARPELLVIDELGYLAYGNRHADLLFEIINRRYEARSTILTTNRPFEEWSEVFPNAPCVVSIVERLVHHSEILLIAGDSYRMHEARERAATARTQRPPRRKRSAKGDGEGDRS